MPEPDCNLDMFLGYVNNSNKYRSKLKIAINNKLWEYATVLIWKNIILGVYEKLFQIKIIGGQLPEDINRQLKSNNVSPNSCFDFCCIPDKSIHTNLGKIWCNFENNYKNTFQGLLEKRNSLSHVNRYEDDFNETWFKTYFEESVCFVKYLQELHLNQYGDLIYENIGKDIVVPYISENDIYYFLNLKNTDENIIFDLTLNSNINLTSDKIITLVKNKYIDNFLKSKNYADANYNGQKLLKVVSYLDKKDYLIILAGIFDQNTPIKSNQIIFADKIEEIIGSLFDNSLNFDLDIEWIDFYNKLADCGLSNKFSSLKGKIDEIYDYPEL